MAEDIQQTIQDFEQSRITLVNVSTQKQQMELQQKLTEETLDVLGKTEEKKVYKAVGNIMVLTDTAAVTKELKDQKESLELRVKTLQKQEETLIDKLNKLKNTIEASQPKPDPSKNPE